MVTVLELVVPALALAWDWASDWASDLGLVMPLDWVLGWVSVDHN